MEYVEAVAPGCMESVGSNRAFRCWTTRQEQTIGLARSNLRTRGVDTHSFITKAGCAPSRCAEMMPCSPTVATVRGRLELKRARLDFTAWVPPWGGGGGAALQKQGARSLSGLFAAR